ncbi:MAG: CCA tRNA nucleotidyltransferase [Patescibacteria group bacterium]|nr:CCA tRNA nucleotidyltransferase [Patescibacteria group bacterium]
MKIPSAVQKIAQELIRSSFQAFLVGGCVRDLLRKKTPADWDIATNALPKQVQALFPNNFYQNKFGTVGVKTKKNRVIEITTFRTEKAYSDHRHPDSVTFSTSIKQDLARRDFTINAMALNLESFLKNKAGKSKPENLSPFFFDPFYGQKDLKNKLVRAVGHAPKRFQEDALRLLRAARFMAQLKFKIEAQTLAAMKKNASLLQEISRERIRDELVKIILSPDPSLGIKTLKQTSLLKYVLPELEQGIGMNQNQHHRYTVWKHSLLSLKYCPSPKLSVRLAALLHDIAKPQTKRGEGKQSTFYNHDLIGSRVARQILSRLRFSKKITQKVALLIKNHMFYYEVDTVTPASIRRLLSKVGPKNIQDLIDLRIADRLGSGCPKAKPYKLRHLEYLVEKVSRDPISVKMLKINGHHLFKKANIQRGPIMGIILNVLLSEVLDNPRKNTPQYLLQRAKDLKNQNLSALKQKAAGKIQEKKIEEDQVLKRKYWIK